MCPPHVLVVDDPCLPTLDVQGRLAKLGYNVISLSVSSAETIAESAKSKPDLAVMDFFHENEIDDVSTADRVRTVLNIPVVFVTEEILKRNSANVLQQPFSDLDLKAAIDLAIDEDKVLVKAKGPLKNSPKLRDVKGTSDRGVSPAKSKKGSAEAFELVGCIPAFKGLPEQARRELVAHARFDTVEAGEYIAFEGDTDDASFIVVSGRFAMTKTAASGKELVVELLGPGDFFGLIFALEKLPAQLSARAQTESEVLWITTSVLLRVLADYPQLYKAFSEHLSARLHLSHGISHGLAHDSVKVRIASLLLTLVAKFSRVRNELSSPIVFDITRQQIADLTGTTPETAIRVTRAMHSAGIINVSSPGVLRITDIAALRKLAEELSD